MRTKRLIYLASTALLWVPLVRAADIGTAITYQGFLEKPAGTPLSETCNFLFSLWDGPIVPPAIQVGDAPIFDGQPGNEPPIAIVDGVFSAQLDFGSGIFDGQARWLWIWVQCAGDPGYVQLNPRVELTPVPYALALLGLYTQQNATSPNLIGGYSGNIVNAGVIGATIGGGGVLGNPNTVAQDYGTVGGGRFNSVGGDSSTVGGGFGNYANGAVATVGGGQGNNATGDYCTVAGGGGNNPSGLFSTIGGGSSNIASGDHSTVGGGNVNKASDLHATVGGGDGNKASGVRSTVGGGVLNEAGGGNSTVGGGEFNVASGALSTVGGGTRNTASGPAATVPGGDNNVALGWWSLAAGRRAKANHDGTFVWADSTDADFTSTGFHQFLIRAGGGVGINTNDPTATLHIGGAPGGTNGIRFPDGTLQTTAGGGGGGTTLDQAYDQGGAGAGRTITADAGPVEIAGPDGLTVAGTIKSGSSIIIDGTANTINSSANLALQTTGGSVGIGHNAPIYPLHVVSPSTADYSRAIFGHATGATGITNGLWGRTDAPSGNGIWGEATPTTGGSWGVLGTTESSASDAYGVAGLARATSGLAVGTFGESYSDSGKGVLGYAGSPTGTTTGTYGWSASTVGRGVVGFASATTGLTFGVRGFAYSESGEGVRGEATSATGTTYGIRGKVLSAGGYAGYFEGRGYFSGNVGIGDTLPDAALDVNAGSAVVAKFNRLGTVGSVVEFEDDGVVVGTISFDAGGTVTYGAFTGSHLAWTENMESIEHGALVSMTGYNRRWHDLTSAEIVYGIAASTTPNDPRCLGAYRGLLNPAETFSADNPHQVMAVGNGDMWVVDTGRNIEPGHYLISSDLKGHAMLDDAERYPIGYVVARAGEGVDWTKVSESVDASVQGSRALVLSGRKHKRISVFFESFERGSAVGLAKIVEQQQARIEALERAGSAGVVRAGLPLALVALVALVALRRRSSKAP